MRQRGDTIVEVLFAVTVFSLVAVGGLAIMNQGTAMAQRSLEIGLVRDQMDAQADALRYIHSAYLANFDQPTAATTETWKNVTEKHSVTQAQALEADSNGVACQIPVATPNGSSDGKPFAIDIYKLDPGSGDPTININQADTYAQVRYPDSGVVAPTRAEGIWIQAVYSPPVSGVSGYYDFHIRACWLTPGQLAPVSLGTIVRLYEPKQ